MKILIVFGTRPEIIKMASLINECEKARLDCVIVHTGQHYSYEMDRMLLENLNVPPPKHHLGVGSGSHGKQMGDMLQKIEGVLRKEKPELVLVQGDTNTTLAGALSAAKLGIKVGHVEAGLRSYDKKMPEEINRVLTDHCSDFLFAPTENSKKILLGEGIAKERVFVTGNTIVDVIYQNMKTAEMGESLIRLNIKPKKYFLVTIHRQENVDNRERFDGILKGLENVGEEFDRPILYPIHPRSKKRMKEFNLITSKLRLIAPVDFTTFLQLEKNAELILTDSGGVQEETCLLRVPCVTLRDNTERPETLDVGSNLLAGTRPENILKSAKIMLGRDHNWENPFGDGNAGKTIVRTLLEALT